MAPSAQAVYFPVLPLDQSGIIGEQPLLYALNKTPSSTLLPLTDRHRSWESALRTFNLLDSQPSPLALDNFLRDETVLSLLSNPLAPFPPPSPQSKSDFESRTEASYNIDQIKADALWLSAEVNVNEVHALRIVLLERQNKASAQLLSEWSEEERLSIQNVTAIATFRASTAPTPEYDSTTQTSRFDQEPQRRARLVSIHSVEATSLVALSASLIGFNLPEHLQPTRDNAPPRPALTQVAKAVWDSQKPNPDVPSPRTFFVECCDALKSRVANLSDPSKWPKIVAEQPELATIYSNSIADQILSLLRLAYIHSYTFSGITPRHHIVAWFELMDQSMYLSNLPVSSEAMEALAMMQCLVSLISVSLIKAKDVIDFLNDSASLDDDTASPKVPETSYWPDQQSVCLITNTLLGAAAQRIRHAGPAMLVWSFVAQALRGIALTLRAERQLEDSSDNEQSPGLARSPTLRRSSLLSRTYSRDSVTPPTKFDNWLDLILDTLPGEDAISVLGNIAVGDLQALETVTAISEALLLNFAAPSDLHIAICGKTSLLSLIREGYPCLQYGPELAQAVISIISYDAVPPHLSHARIRTPVQPAKAFMDDTATMRGRFLEQARQRYGYELRPLLKCLLALSQSRASLTGDESEILAMLDNMTTFTQVMPISFEDYDLVQEDDMQNYIQLSSDLPIFSPRGMRGIRALTLKAQASDDLPGPLLSIPAGSVGLVMSTQKPHVVRWELPHSGLEYLGQLLSTLLPNATIVDATTQAPVDKETAAEIIALADSLIATETSIDCLPAAMHIVSRLSLGLDRDDDIVRIVFEIFERELQAQIDQPIAEGSLYLLVHCARFLQSMIRLYPERIWSLFARSKLLNVSDGSGALAAIVTATELPLGQFDFLRCCIGLFEGLVDDSIRRAVSRKTTTKALTRFEDRNMSVASAPDKSMSATLAAFQRVMLDVLQSLPSWKFIFESERSEINTRIFNAMNSVLRHAYGMDDTLPVPAKLSGVFAQAGDAILDAFLVENPHELTFHPILTVFLSAIAESDDRTNTSNERRNRDQTRAALEFCSTALDVGLLAAHKIDYLTTNLLQAMPIVTRLFAARHYYKLPVANVMTSVVRSLSRADGEPASLLGHLGSEAMKCFLLVIAALDLPLQDINTETAIWNMLSVVVSNKQQWLAVCLLTGSTPRDKLKEKSSDSSTTKAKRPLFSYALDQLAKIEMLSPKRAIAILTFIARAQDHWSWATTGIGRHTNLIKSLTTWIANLTPNTRTSDMEAVTRQANENQIAALIADILARYLHNARQLGDVSTAKTVASSLQYLRDNGVAVDGYNHSLHKNLAKNFSAKFSQCSLSNFKRSALCPAEFGREYYYDREVAGRMLDFDGGWGRKSGFFDEFARANVNLSLVESQVNLLKSWKALATGLGQFASDDAALQRDLAGVATKSLKANIDALIPTELFENIAQLRADLSFVLVQQLTASRSKEVEVKGLLSTAWEALRTSGLDFETVSTARDLDYFRTLLRILFLAIQPHVYDPSHKSVPDKSTTTKGFLQPSSQVAPVLLEIVERVLTLNFRALCGAVHADASSAEPADFVLLTALLQSILRVPDMASSHASVAAIFASAGTARYATSLFSWADQLAAASETGDPVYGELSILLLLELSSVPLLAEQMAVDGVLSNLSAANLSQFFRKPGGKGAFEEPVRMFSIWTRGMLPLCLNLMEAVGPPIVIEVGAFLNSFPEQLKRAETDLENRQPSLRQPYAGNVTLGMAAETHSLSLISAVLERLKVIGSAAGVNADEVPSLAYDRAGVKEEIEGLLRGRRAFRERIVPVGEREVEWVKQKASKDGQQSESRLEERIVDEFEAALVCLTS